MLPPNYEWLVNEIKGPMTHESPDGGKTIKSRAAVGHPIHMLTKGIIPFDVWYKIFKDKHDY